MTNGPCLATGSFNRLPATRVSRAACRQILASPSYTWTKALWLCFGGALVAAVLRYLGGVVPLIFLFCMLFLIP
jgi:hypothetical protein